MCKIGASRLCRCLICLLLVGCFLIYSSPLRAHATAAVAPVVSSVAVVSVPGALVVGATLIALGVYAGVETGAFESLANSAVDFLDTAGGWIKDGSMELLKTVDSAGKATYYAAGDLLETLRGWIFGNNIVSDIDFIPESVSDFSACQSAIVKAQSFSYYFTGFTYSGQFIVGWFDAPFIVTDYTYPSGLTRSRIYSSSSGSSFFYYRDGMDSYQSNCLYAELSNYTLYQTGINDLYHTTQDLTLGKISSVPIDGTSARDWSEEYADRRLYVVNNGGGSDPGNDDDGDHSGKWFWPLAGALTAGELYLLSQVDEWSADTPSEFPEGDSKTEFEILDRPEFEGLPGLEISPVQDPAVEPSPDPEPDPDPEPSPSPEPDPDPDPSPEPSPSPDPDPNPDPAPDLNPDSGSSGSDTGQLAQRYDADWKSVFPFCVPFDLIEFLNVLAAEPEAPVVKWRFYVPRICDEEIVIDLSAFDSVAQIVRTLELLAFCIGLILLTRNIIRG